jgi:hypothetical protein
MIQKMSVILGIMLALGSVAGAMEYRYGPRVQVVSNATEIKKIKLLQRKRAIEERIWNLERDFGYDIRTYPPKYAREYKKLQSELNDIERELNRL